MSDRLRELLAQRATADLSDADRRELDSLLGSTGGDDSSFDLAAAAIYEAFASVEEGAQEDLPADLRARLAEAGAREVGRGGAEVVDLAAVRPERTATPALAWWAAAACLALAVVGWWPRIGPDSAPTEPPSPVVTVAEQRQDLLAAPDARTLAWSATEDVAAAGAEGDVVWSPSRQEGYMRIRNLQPNDASEWQYQLWVFDRERDEQYPVDGGVFDMPAGTGETIVPIDAKIFVGEPYLFAVTVEPPGGVVVSDRERIVLVAQV